VPETTQKVHPVIAPRQNTAHNRAPDQVPDAAPRFVSGMETPDRALHLFRQMPSDVRMQLMSYIL
jgi:hypothetical protein